MRRKHFGVRIDIHTGSGSLFQKHLEVPQIVSGNQDPGVLANTEVDRRDFRITISLCIGFVQQCHAGNTILSGFQSQGDEVIERKRIVQSFCKSALQKCIDLLIILKQGIGMFRVCRQAFQTISDEFPQRTDIFVFRGKNTNQSGLCIEFCFFSIPE